MGLLLLLQIGEEGLSAEEGAIQVHADLQAPFLLAGFLQRAKAAGAIIEESELLDVDASIMGHGGLMGHSQDELRQLQQTLLPEGSRQYYNQQGLPNGTEREENDDIGYERVTIPPPVRDVSKLHPRLRIEDILDSDSAIAFGGMDSLNPMQSTVFDTAFHRRENMLVCAPTGAGKTNVAMLTLTAHFRDVGLIGYEEDLLDAGDKVVYIAPMKVGNRQIYRDDSLFGHDANPRLLLPTPGSRTRSSRKVFCEAQAAGTRCEGIHW